MRKRSIVALVFVASAGWAVSALGETPPPSRIEPKVAPKVVAAPTQKATPSGDAGSTSGSSTQSAMDQDRLRRSAMLTAEQMRKLQENARGLSAEVDTLATAGKAIPTEVRAAARRLVADESSRVFNMPIEDLVMLVMMQVAKEANDDLKSLLGEMAKGREKDPKKAARVKALRVRIARTEEALRPLLKIDGGA